MVAIALLAGAGEAHASKPSMAGEWIGTYKQFRYNVTFRVKITEVDQNFEGDMTEPRVYFGPPDARTLPSKIKGQVDGLKVTFDKVYDYDGHHISYSGTFSFSDDIVNGTWQGGLASGSFHMQRVK